MKAINCFITVFYEIMQLGEKILGNFLLHYKLQKISPQGVLEG